MIRDKATNEQIESAIELLREALYLRLESKGYGMYVGPHETFGVLYEEMNELNDDMRANNNLGFINELIDIAVGATFGIVSMREKIK